ncbi:hypothetical protein, partial [Nocardioides mangrovicus]|uniref:hypothetical protein n=1 Tax=Nocardioides mangrovicus TaxID=2478913 RepID=UPI0011C473CD
MSFTLSSGGLWAIAGLVTDGPYDAVASATNTALTTTPTIPAYTPVAADTLAVYFIARKRAAGET